MRALEGLAGERMGKTKLSALKISYGLAPSPPKGSEKTGKEPKSKTSKKPPKPDPAGFYKALYQDLEKNQPVAENALTALARKRANAVVSFLTTAGGIPANRLKTIESKGEGPVEGDMITLQLNLAAKEK